MNYLKKLKSHKVFLIIFLFGFATLSTSCEELFEDEFDDEFSNENTDDGGSGNQNSGYDYTFNCPVSGEATVPIPPGSAECQQAYEFFARTYGCNDVANFNAANCALCYDCQDENYCQVCD